MTKVIPNEADKLTKTPFYIGIHANKGETLDNLVRYTDTIDNIIDSREDLDEVKESAIEQLEEMEGVGGTKLLIYKLELVEVMEFKQTTNLELEPVSIE